MEKFIEVLKSCGYDANFEKTKRRGIWVSKKKHILSQIWVLDLVEVWKCFSNRFTWLFVE